MGMFDSFYDAAGHEWQTKAFACLLDRYEIGDAVEEGPTFTYQVKVLGGPDDGLSHSLATIRDGVLAAVPDERDAALPLLDYRGGWTHAENGA